MLLGPNGSGKTTLMKAMLGLVRCRGEVRINGKSVDRLSGELGVATNMEEVYYILSLNVRELIDLYTDLRGADRGYALSLIDEFGLRGTLDKKLWHLSTGEKKLVANALAIASKPRTLLLDEIFEGVDPARKMKLATLLNEFEGSVLFTTHELGMLKYFGYWDLYFMFDGKIFGRVRPSSRILSAGIVVGEVPDAILRVEAAGKAVSIVDGAGTPFKEFTDLNILYGELVAR